MGDAGEEVDDGLLIRFGVGDVVRVPRGRVADVVGDHGESRGEVGEVEGSVAGVAQDVGSLPAESVDQVEDLPGVFTRVVRQPADLQCFVTGCRKVVQEGHGGGLRCSEEIPAVVSGGRGLGVLTLLAPGSARQLRPGLAQSAFR
ncbi:hypothetical protein ACFYYN_38080 [Streptomyces sp. NPDC001902]